MGFGHRVYRAEDPRARVLRRTCSELKAPRYEVAEALEQAALKELRERRPDHPIETNVEFWAAVILDFAEVPPHMMPAMFTCARTAGWCAHIMEQKREAKLVRPSAQYIGPAPRSPRTSRAGTRSPTWPDPKENGRPPAGGRVAGAPPRRIGVIRMVPRNRCDHRKATLLCVTICGHSAEMSPFPAALPEWSAQFIPLAD